MTARPTRQSAAARSRKTADSPERQLAAFLAKFSREVAKEARDARARMQKRIPGAVELVYDNYNALVIGFGPTEKPSEALCSLAIFPRWVTLCFLNGVSLPDPEGLLRGEGNQVRNIRLNAASDIDTPPIATLISHAIARATKPFSSRRGTLIIKSISAKQRPRRVD